MKSIIVHKDNFKSILNTLTQEYSDVTSWIIDVETNGLDVYSQGTVLCGIGLTPILNHTLYDSAPIYYLPFRHDNDDNLSMSDMNELMQFLNKTCRILIGYNVKFDAKFLEKEGMDISNMQMIDVLVMVKF